MRWTLAPILIVSLFAFADPPATSDEIARMVSDHQYPQSLQRIAAALALKGPAAKSVDHYQLCMLKAECHLQMRSPTMAVEAYDNAVKEATEPKDKSIATAHAMLLKQSKAFAYTPKTTAPGKPRPTPIDILDKENRKKAFAALLADELAANDAKFKAAKAAQSLPPIAETFKPLTVMEGLELAGTGAAEKVTAVRTEMIEQAKKIVADGLRAISKRVGEIDKNANTFVEFYQDTYDAFSRFPRTIKEKAYKKKGLSDQDTKELQATTATCDKIAPALSEMGEQLKAGEKTFDPFIDEAARIRKEVDRILDTDYQRVYKEIPKK
jgi:hypothetical protein